MTTLYIIGFIVLCIIGFIYKVKPKGMSFSQFANNNTGNIKELFVTENIPQFQTILGIVFVFCLLNSFYTEPKMVCGETISESIVNYGSKEKPKKYVRVVLKDATGKLYKDEIKLYIFESLKGDVCLTRTGNDTKFYIISAIVLGSLIILLIFFRDDVH